MNRLQSRRTDKPLPIAKYRLAIRISDPNAPVRYQEVRDSIGGIKRFDEQEDCNKVTKHHDESEVALFERDLSSHFGKERVSGSFEKVKRKHTSKISYDELDRWLTHINLERQELRNASILVEEFVSAHKVEKFDSDEKTTLVDRNASDVQDVKIRIGKTLSADPGFISNEGEELDVYEWALAQKVRNRFLQHDFRLREIEVKKSELGLTYHPAPEINLLSNKPLDDNWCRARAVWGKVLATLWEQYGVEKPSDSPSTKIARQALRRCIVKIADDLQAKGRGVEGITDPHKLIELGLRLSPSGAKSRSFSLPTKEEAYREDELYDLFLNLPNHVMAFYKQDWSEPVIRPERNIEQQMLMFSRLEITDDPVFNVRNNFNAARRYLKHLSESKCGIVEIYGNYWKRIRKTILLALASDPEMARRLVSQEKQVRLMVNDLIDEHLLRVLEHGESIFTNLAATIPRDLSTENPSILGKRGSHEPLFAYSERLLLQLNSPDGVHPAYWRSRVEPQLEDPRIKRQPLLLPSGKYDSFARSYRARLEQAMDACRNAHNYLLKIRDNEPASDSFINIPGFSLGFTIDSELSKGLNELLHEIEGFSEAGLSKSQSEALLGLKSILDALAKDLDAYKQRLDKAIPHIVRVN